MSTMLLETERNLCEDLERLEQAIADRYLEEPRNIRERLTRDNQIARFIDRFSEQSQRLLEIRADNDGKRKREIESLTHGDPFEEFYRQLNQIREFHRRYPNEPVENLERAYKRRATEATGDEDVMFGDANIDAMFTGEELHGRYLDLTQCHTEYLNLPNVKRISYLQYLEQFDRFVEFQGKPARNDKYFRYLTHLAEYLEGFLRRAKPLSNPDKIMREISENFEKDWEEGKVEGWGQKVIGPSKPEERSELYCKACDKLFANQNVFDAHFNGKKHKKAEERLKEEEDSTPSTPRLGTGNLKQKAMAEREYRIRALAALLQKEKEGTKTNVERKASLTEREREVELEALMRESELGPSAGNEKEDDDDDDEKIYNPLKLPLAWDGKPIPYWLYKLHGLGVEFPCEICGNFVYMGRRAFDKHFSEWRHIHGLKCLGITNTTLFREITKIEDAEKLWAKIQADRKAEKQANENITEMEDEEGNVMSQQVYEDLKKQGLI